MRCINIGRYDHNYKGLYEKSTYQMFVTKGRTTTTQCAHASVVGIISFILLFSLSEEI